MARLTTDEFIRRAKDVHGEKYDYSSVSYISSKSYINIICPIHGMFPQRPNNHLCGYGCVDCGGSRKKTTGQFIAEAKKVHDNFFDYSLVKYVDARSTVKIKCPKHTVFEQTPDNHLRGQRCPGCRNERIANTLTRSTQEFISRAEKIHGEKYSYQYVEYEKSKIDVRISCPLHGTFSQVPEHHLQGQGCPDCGGTRKRTLEEFVSAAIQVHGDKYDYSLVEYKNNQIDVSILCPVHGTFSQKPSNHLLGKGCRYCAGKYRDTKRFIEKATSVHGSQYIYDNSTYVDGNTELLITCPHHGDFFMTPRSHLQGASCHGCAKYGFDPTQSAIFYYVKLSVKKDIFYKVGITNRTVEKRFYCENDIKIEIIFTEYFDIGAMAKAVEQHYLKKYAKYKYLGPSLLKVGNTEILTHDVLNQLPLFNGDIFC